MTPAECCCAGSSAACQAKVSANAVVTFNTHSQLTPNELLQLAKCAQLFDSYPARIGGHTILLSSHVGPWQKHHLHCLFGSADREEGCMHPQMCICLQVPHCRRRPLPATTSASKPNSRHTNNSSSSSAGRRQQWWPDGWSAAATAAGGCGVWSAATAVCQADPDGSCPTPADASVQVSCSTVDRTNV